MCFIAYQETRESITYRMLDRVVAVELVPQAICHAVRPYMEEHGLKEDRMLYQYIGVTQQCLLVTSGVIQLSLLLVATLNRGHPL